jgi:hypothetical protein
MTHRWDEFSKSLAEESVPRRETLRRLGAVFAGAALMPFSLALGAPKSGGQNACKTFCTRCPKQQQSQCLAACQACNNDPSRLCGSCGNYACCGNGLACCGGACVDMFNDFDNCGGCGLACDQPGPYEDGACADGTCLYQCVTGATRCNGICTLLGSDSANCGACGNVCGGPDPYCNEGVCSECYPGLANCGGSCVDLAWDNVNCGACGNVCGGPNPNCNQGVCSECYPGQTRCRDSCVDLAYDRNNCGACGNVCGGATPYCSGGQCTDCAGAGGAICNGFCIDVMWDSLNCGGCGNVCPGGTYCAWGVCEGICYDCY